MFNMVDGKYMMIGHQMVSTSVQVTCIDTEASSFPVGISKAHDQRELIKRNLLFPLSESVFIIRWLLKFQSLQSMQLLFSAFFCYFFLNL